MRSFYFIFFFIALLGCSFSKKENQAPMALAGTPESPPVISPPPPPLNPQTDSDGDFIPDDIEISNGSDPFVANLPEISWEIKNYKINVNYRNAHLLQELSLIENNVNFSADQNTFLRHLALKNSLLKLRNLNEDLLGLRQTPENMSDLNRFSQDTFINLRERRKTLQNTGYSLGHNQGEVFVTLRLKGQSSLYYTQLSDLHLDALVTQQRNNSLMAIGTQPILDAQNNNLIFILNPQTQAQSPEVTLKWENISAALIDQALLNQENFFISLTNYTVYNSLLQRSFAYSDLMQSVKSKCIRLITSTPQGTKVIFVSPEKNLQQTLALSHSGAVLDGQNNLLEMDGFSNSLVTPVSWQNLTLTEMNQGKWVKLGDDSADKDLFYTYGLASDFLKASFTAQTVLQNVALINDYPHNFISQAIPVRAGDILDIDIQNINRKQFNNFITDRTWFMNLSPCPLACNYWFKSYSETTQALPLTQNYLQDVVVLKNSTQNFALHSSLEGAVTYFENSKGFLRFVVTPSMIDPQGELRLHLKPDPLGVDTRLGLLYVENYCGCPAQTNYNASNWFTATSGWRSHSSFSVTKWSLPN